MPLPSLKKALRRSLPVALVALPASIVPAALLTLENAVVGETPEVLAYNLGHFFPGSNTADWWRYSRASGARVFLAPSHFNVGGTVRPGENTVVDQASFLARRDALRADPLNTDFINWPIVEGRFNVSLTGNNRIVPQYAFEEIHRRGGTIKAQMTLSAGAFPIADEDDWAGKWVAWRTFYSVAFYLAREFDVERFASHNEPNHPSSFIEPEPWLMRLRLASDAVQAALADVNALYGKNLQPRFKAPVTAGSRGASLNDYGLPAVSTIGENFLGETPPGYQVFHHYAYQRYNQTPAAFASDFLALRGDVDAATPPGIAPLPFAITEYNVHTGATYDGMPESSDTLSKAIRFGAITSRLAAAGMDELYAFKFGMTAYSNNFPVQKNGMAFSDNNNAPHNYGTLGRSAEVYRLFNKGFAPGRELLAHTLTGTGAGNLTVLVSRDPASGFIHIFSANETGNAVPLEIDLAALNLPEGNHAIIEDVSQWRTGLVRSVERISGGRLTPGNQPGQTVWLIQINPVPERENAPTDGPLVLPVAADLMVRDGIHANASFAHEPAAYARNDAASADGRAAAFLRFDLPPDWDPDDLLIALLALPVRTLNGGPETVHAHLHGIDDHAWDPATLTWNTAPNLGNNAPLGDQIRHRVVEGAGETAHVLGQITVGGDWTLRQVDVTDYLRDQDGHASFLLTQDPRWDVDIRVSEVPASWSELTIGDTQPDGLRIRTSREAATPEEAPRLILVRRAPVRLSYQDWIERFFPPKLLFEDTFTYPDGPLAGQGEWARGPGSPNPDNPSNHLVVSDGAVLFDWMTNEPVNNIVRRLWAAEDIVEAGAVYATFRLRVLEAPEPAADTRPGFLAFADGSGNQQRGFVGIRAGTTPGTFQLGVSPASQLLTNFVFAPANLAVGSSHEITVRFDTATQETSLWINSDLAASPAVTAPGSGSNAGIRRVNLRLYNADGSGGTTRLGRFLLDDLAVFVPDPETTAATANPAGDGLPNLLKFALGLDPRIPAALPVISLSGESGNLTLRFNRNTLAEGLELIVERSADLLDWQPHPEAPEVVVDGPIQELRLSLELDPAQPPVFLRLRANHVQ